MTSDSTAFADLIRDRYPEGLTGVFAVGGTRMTYILAQKRQDHDPGHIPTMADYAEYGFDLLRSLIENFFDLGGQNIIVPALSYQLFNDDRGSEYAEVAAQLTYRLMEDRWLDFYQRLNIDPYFTGIDTLLHLPEQKFTYDLGRRCDEFNQTWSYQEGRRKLIWEVAPIPLYSFWRAHQVMGADEQARLETELAAATDLQTMHDVLNQYYARAVYGTDIPKPHFYVGTNRNGDLKLRALLPIALLCGDPFRLFYTPYPSLFLTRETLQAILEDLAFGKPLRSSKTDYGGQITSEVVQAEYQRVLEVSANPLSTIGFVRHVQHNS